MLMCALRVYTEKHLHYCSTRIQKSPTGSVQHVRVPSFSISGVGGVGVKVCVSERAQAASHAARGASS